MKKRVKNKFSEMDDEKLCAYLVWSRDNLYDVQEEYKSRRDLAYKKITERDCKLYPVLAWNGNTKKYDEMNEADFIFPLKFSERKMAFENKLSSMKFTAEELAILEPVRVIKEKK